MRVLTRYKYVQIRVFRPLRRTRRTFCLVLFTAFLFGLFTFLLEIFNTTDRYRTFSMVPYSGNLSELRQSFVTREPEIVPKIHQRAITVPPTNYNHTKTILGRHKPLITLHSSTNITHKVHEGKLPFNSTLLDKRPSKVLPVPKESALKTKRKSLNSTLLEKRSGKSLQLPKQSAQKTKINLSRPKSKYLSYKENFVYPLDINLTTLVNASMNGIENTKHKPINPHDFWYLHKPYNCNFKLKKNAKKNMLVLVKSYVGNIAQRVALRTLWNNTKDSNMRRVFMLGYQRPHQLAVDNESRKYHDIIQENFVDDYMNNTFKTIMAYNWATKYCRRAHVILFLDDDYLVNMTVMAAHVRTVYQNQSSGLYTGTLAKHAPPYRDKNERWYLTYKQYPYDEFPPYVGGGAYVVSFDVAKKFKYAFPYVQYMGIDDVYLGIVAKKLDIKPKNDPYLDSHSKVSIAKECSHNATDLLKRVCPLRLPKKVGRTIRRVRHKPVNAAIFVLCFGLAITCIVLLSCCLSD
ncbi:lactosylceramide 1,3-N-acetyl-beta-D-glucosaminyltransferase-like [Argopecten irradians]|uniref:lactosylceramide 1,3-N-acetyl-beta-D-glucosaminyltransferase-like n=1 Tax=Argopecten irradians TaxID=31199 RepID=UPI00372328EC